MIVARVVGAGDDDAGRATSALRLTACATSSFSVPVFDGDGTAAGVDDVDVGGGAAELGAGEEEEPPPHKPASSFS